MREKQRFSVLAARKVENIMHYHGDNSAPGISVDNNEHTKARLFCHSNAFDCDENPEAIKRVQQAYLYGEVTTQDWNYTTSPLH